MCQEISKRESSHRIGFYKGFIGSIGRSLVSYPFDTLKIVCQTNTKIRCSIGTLYRGMSTQLLTNGVLGGTIIKSEEICYAITKNHAASGFMSGGLCSILTIPLDFIKLQRQCHNHSLKTILLKNPYVGWQTAMLREAVVGSMFFGAFHGMRHKNIDTSVSAALAGFTTVITSHPFDVIKNRLQLGITLRQALLMKNFGSGLSISCGKSVLMNFISYSIISKI